MAPFNYNKFLVVAALILANAVAQSMYISYCKRNLLVYYFMRDAAVCRGLNYVNRFSEDAGMTLLEGVFNIGKFFR